MTQDELITELQLFSQLNTLKCCKSNGVLKLSNC